MTTAYRLLKNTDGTLTLCEVIYSGGAPATYTTNVRVSPGSTEDIKAQLRAMLDACDAPLFNPAKELL
jgi:hypothetical protein